MTQEELAEGLYVSRTAISKWESGRGYPSIDSLKAIADFFSVSVDELLSGKELMTVAERDSKQKLQHIRDLVFGLLDCSIITYLFLPFFGQKIDGVIYEVSLINLTAMQGYIIVPYFILVFLTMFWGIAILALQYYQGAVWVRCKSIVSIILSIVSTMLFILTMQPYAALFTLLFLIIKGVMVSK